MSTTPCSLKGSSWPEKEAFCPYVFSGRSRLDVIQWLDVQGFQLLFYGGMRLQWYGMGVVVAAIGMVKEGPLRQSGKVGSSCFHCVCDGKGRMQGWSGSDVMRIPKDWWMEKETNACFVVTCEWGLNAILLLLLRWYLNVKKNYFPFLTVMCFIYRCCRVYVMLSHFARWVSVFLFCVGLFMLK